MLERRGQAVPAVPMLVCTAATQPHQSSQSRVLKDCARRPTTLRVQLDNVGEVSPRLLICVVPLLGLGIGRAEPRLPYHQHRSDRLDECINRGGRAPPRWRQKLHADAATVEDIPCHRTGRHRTAWDGVERHGTAWDGVERYGGHALAARQVGRRAPVLSRSRGRST